jgi:hypothetical protein
MSKIETILARGLRAALVLMLLTPAYAVADGGNASLVHACVDRWTRVRIVGPNDPCDPGERAMHWVLAGPQGQTSQSGSTPPNAGQASPRAPGAGQTIQPNARVIQPWGQATQPGGNAPPTPTCPGANLASDPMNCGYCGNQCAGGTVCTTGACVSPGCSAAKPNICGATCVNLDIDAKNCGACGRVCPATNRYCVDGGCMAMPN